MPRYGMVIDLDRCSACGACAVACQVENNLPDGSRAAYDQGREMHWMELLPVVEGHFPEVKARILPRPCMHCDDPPCVKVCPVGATTLGEDGIVAQIYHRCIGCRYCTTACPYTVRTFNWFEPERSADDVRRRNPDVSLRQKGVVEKCTFCHHRLQRAREQARFERRPLREGDYVPACVESCPADAMFFGDLDDPESRVAQLERSKRAFTLLEELGTHPKVIYLSEEEA